VELIKILEDITQKLGPSGFEGYEAADAIAAYFKPYCELTTDALGSVVARMGSGSPTILLDAHMDEIGVITTKVEDDGCIRIGRVGGLDPRVLPGSRVTIHAVQDGKRHDITGVVGALPPHLLSAEDREKNYKLEDLFVDAGLPADEVRRLVPVGSLVSVSGKTVTLKGNRVASKVLDDRAAVAVLIRTAEILSAQKFNGTVVFCAAAQEEVGGFGAMTAAYGINPDWAVAFDLSFATHGKEAADGLYPLDTLTIAHGSHLHPLLTKKLEDAAKPLHIKTAKEFAADWTGTDADDIQTAHNGIPVALLGVPGLYMHTPVEVVSLDALEDAARLLAEFVRVSSVEQEGWLTKWDD
jgi:endoglucanase